MFDQFGSPRQAVCPDPTIDVASEPGSWVRLISSAVQSFALLLLRIRHDEDNDVLGKGHTDTHMMHGFELLKWIGANSFRTSHCPYSVDVVEYADLQGIVIIEEAAAVGMNMGLGGGIFGTRGCTTFSPETMDDQSHDPG